MNKANLVSPSFHFNTEQMDDLLNDLSYSLESVAREIIQNESGELTNATEKETFEAYNKLNNDESHHATTDDICTPMECVQLMIDYIPNELWQRKNIKVFDPCCGNGNFGAYCRFRTNENNIFYNDLNTKRIANCKRLLNPLNITTLNFLTMEDPQKYDLIMANPPYSGGGNKNQSLSNFFIKKSIDLLADKGYLCFVVPNNWKTYNKNNTTLRKLLNNGSFIVIDNDIKKYFANIGSSFTVFIWQKGIFDNTTKVINSYLVKDTQEVIIPRNLPFIPLYISQTIIGLVERLMNGDNNKFNYRCDLHNFTQKEKLSDIQDDIFKYETIHTAKKTRYANMKQDIYDKWTIIIPLSTYFVPYIKTNVNVTQSVGYIAFDTKAQADEYLQIITQPQFKLLVHLTRYGNFNNIMVLKHLKFDEDMFFSHEEVVEMNELLKHIKY